MSNAHFSKMPSVSIPRTMFNMNFTHKTSMLHGDLVPIDCFEVLPGDTFKLELSSLIRMSTPITALMDDLEMSYHAFFIPMRLLWSHTEEFYGANKTSSGYQEAVYKIPAKSVYTAGVPKGSVSHYLGKPVAAADSNKANAGRGMVSVLKERAYWLVWSEWYRAQQVQNPFLLTTDDGTNIGSVDGSWKGLQSLPAKVCKEYDYFTASTIAPQYGASVTLPLGSLAPIFVKNQYGTPLAAGTQIKTLTEASSYQTTEIGVAANEAAYADLSQATAATINSLRYAFAVQKYLERSNYGSRFFEMLKVHYGITSPDARLQRPEYLGGHKFYINIQQVLATADTASGGNTTPLGTVGANSVTGDKCFLFSKGFVEPGYVMIMASTRQVNQTYSQGLLREDIKRDRFEFYSPEFANLGDQATLKKEIYLAGDEGDEQVFGYQEHWAEYRYRPNRVSGSLDPNAPNALSFWTLANKFTNQPEFNAAFVQESRDNLARALTTGSDTTADYICDFAFKYTAVRELPAYTIPGLIDHFGVR